MLLTLPRVDGNDDHEERECEQQVHGFEHLNDARRGAAVEVVDVEDDPVRRTVELLSFRATVVVRNEARQRLEIVADCRYDAEPLAVIVAGVATGQEVGVDGACVETGRHPVEVDPLGRRLRRLLPFDFDLAARSLDFALLGGPFAFRLLDETRQFREQGLGVPADAARDTVLYGDGDGLAGILEFRPRAPPSPSIASPPYAWAQDRKRHL